MALFTLNFSGLRSVSVDLQAWAIESVDNRVCRLRLSMLGFLFEIYLCEMLDDGHESSFDEYYSQDIGVD